jgi:SAM-dependent methyltransferase
LEDPDYEVGREQRAIQQRRLLELVQRLRPAGRLLDIGAASGILVEEALAMGYKAEGIEPSTWLQGVAQRKGLPVYSGVFPSPRTNGPYDVVTIVDVIEHVTEPLELLQAVRKVLAPDGLLLIVTPDVNSVSATLLGWRWWHYRIAHIGYFNRRTLTTLLERAGFATVQSGRPVWYFSLDYLAERITSYLPWVSRLSRPEFLKRTTIPVNVHDSLYVLCRRD